MDSDEEWDEPKYKNWVRGAKGLEYLQEGLQSFTGDRVLQQRDQTLQKITNTFSSGSPVQCNQCTLQNLLPEHAVVNKLCNKNTCTQNHSSNCFGSRAKGRQKCPNGICSKFYDEIVQAHHYKDPMWKNTDPSTWCSDPAGWSLGKCFQTTPSPGTSSFETDASGLLSVILNDNIFHSEVACNLAAKINIFSTAREVRNEILHSPKMELEDSKLQAYIDTFIAVLQDPNCLINDQGANQSVQNLIQLKNNQITISISEHVRLTQVRKDALQALEWLENKKREVVTKLEEQTQDALDKIEGARSDALEVLSDSDLHKRVQQTEAKILSLTNAMQIMKKGVSSKRAESSTDRFLPSIDIPEQSGDVEEGDPVSKEIKRVIDTACGNLIDYMNPDPILEYATEYELFGYRETRDIKEEKNTTEKNRKILEKLRPKGKTGYDKLKTCLNETDQSLLVTLLECVERGTDREPLLKQIHKKAIQDKSQTMKDQPRYKKTNRGKRRKLLDKIPFLTAKRQKELQQDLVEFYRQRHQKLPLSPLIEEVNAPLLKFYVMPEINSVKVQRAFGGGNEIKTRIKTLRNVFFEESSQFKDIYLSADAGLGKTAFSKCLAITWCQAHEPEESEKELFQKDEINAVNDFDFLFLVFLRDSSGKCDTVDLIYDQIIQDLPSHGSPLSKQDIDMVLSEKRCLVVLDGLDEWTHPTSCAKKANPIPHRKAYKRCTVLTTSRPWKLNDTDSSSPRFELVRLNENSKRTLQERVISQLSGETDKNEMQKRVLNFSNDVAKLDISDVDSIPLLLMYLLCLWCDERGLGQSQCELYSNIVELLLSRTVKKYENLNLALPQVDKRATVEIPQCFREQNCCTQYYTLLETLANLAFQTLFCETEEQKLVFDSTIAENCLNKELLQFCLKSGILSQSKDRTKLTKQKAKISFAHKTVQEFFAALYMHSAPDQITVQNKVLSQCNSVKDILEMSKVFIFLSGINVDVLSFISRELIEVINKDEITQEYRAMTYDLDTVKYTEPLKELQDMYISCVKENSQNAELKLFHQDIIIDKDCRQEKYVNYLQQLAVKNKENIRSVSVEMEGIPYSVQEIIDNFELADLRNVDKIYYRGEFHNCDITPLLQRSVKCLSLMSSKWQENQFIPERSTWSASLSNRFYSLDNLECIYIDCFEMIHDELGKLMKHLSTRNSMRDISLASLYCKDHENSCAGFNLDLSLNSQLRKLTLDCIPLSELNINVESLEECDVGHLSKPGLVSRFLSYLPAASKLQIFKCSSLESTEDIETMLTTLRKLVHVKEVSLACINLGDRELSLSPEMVNIEYVQLYKVTMAASVFSHLVSQVNKQQQTVTVGILGCTITPEVEFEKEKDKIKKSPDFSVTYDGIDQDNDYGFMFTTIK